MAPVRLISAQPQTPAKPPGFPTPRNPSPPEPQLMPLLSYPALPSPRGLPWLTSPLRQPESSHLISLGALQFGTVAPSLPGCGIQELPLALAEGCGGRSSRSAPQTHLTVLRKPVVPAHKGPGREHTGQLLTGNFQGPMVLCPIALRKDPECLAAAKGPGPPWQASSQFLLPSCHPLPCPGPCPAVWTSPLLPSIPQQAAALPQAPSSPADTHQHHSMVGCLQLRHSHVPAYHHVATEGTSARASRLGEGVDDILQGPRGEGLGPRHSRDPACVTPASQCPREGNLRGIHTEGLGSLHAAGSLPPLLTLTQVSKPLLLWPRETHLHLGVVRRHAKAHQAERHKLLLIDVHMGPGVVLGRGW